MELNQMISRLLNAVSLTYFTLCASLVYFSDFVSTVSRHSTSKVAWSECMDFGDTQIHSVCDLEGLKRFFCRGLYLRIEEEKVPIIKLDSAQTFRLNMCSDSYSGISDPVMARCS